MSDNLSFGTSGLRGLAADFTDARVAGWVGRFVALTGARTLMIGRDLRASSPAIARSVADAAVGCGCAVTDCGVLPTPALALEAMRRKAAAVMVTGSHIPADRNGLKFYTASGELTKAEEAALAACAPASPAAGGSAGTDSGGALAAYRDRYVAHRAAFDLAGLHVGVDEHSSVARDLLPEVLEALGARVTRRGRSAEFVPVDTEAVGDAQREQARRWAAGHRLDALVSTDGDADRPLVADETGAYLRGDLVGLATAAFLGADVVATPVTSSSAPELSSLFSKILRTRVGSPFVIEAMAAHGGTVVGYEANGGVLLGSPAVLGDGALAALPTRDAMLPILAVLATARRQGLRVSQLESLFPRRFTRSDRLTGVDREGWSRVASSLDTLPPALAAAGQMERIDRADGVRLVFAGGDGIHFRASGNAPELRCYSEAGTAEEADRLLALGLAHARAVLGRG